MIDIFEHLFPGIAQRLYASGISRDMVAHSVNGMALAIGTLVAMALLLFVFRRQIRGFIARANGPRFFMAVLVVLTFLSLPDPVFPMRPGLDYSWQWMLNRLAFGNDWGGSIVFTYGPLGWLIYPSGRWITVLFALAANICFCILWIWSVRRIYMSSSDGRAMAWGLLLTMFFPQQSMEWRWIVLAVVLARVSWFAAGVVAALLSMVKFSAIVMVLGTQVFMLIADRKRKPIAYGLGFSIASVLLVSMLFSSLDAYLKWLAGSVQIASGYNQYMLVDKSTFELLAPILAFFVLVHRPRHFLALLPIAPLLFCAIKYNWVRQGVGPFLYVLTLAAAFLMERFADSRRRFAMVSISFVLIGFGVLWPWHFASGMTYVAFPYGVHPMGLIRSFALPVSMSAAKARMKALVAGSELPDGVRKSIGDATVQLLGHEFAPAMADPTLKILPYATMQMYSTYTAELDAIAAESYRATNAPQFIAIDTMNLSIDSKNAFIDCPRTWAAIRANYSLRDTTEDGRWMLLGRRSVPMPVSLTKKMEVPSATPLDKLVALLFRDKLRFAALETTPGTEHVFRVNPLVLKDPVDCDLPLDVKGLAGYLSQPSNISRSGKGQ